MHQQPFTAIPIVDISDLYSNRQADRLRVAETIRTYARDVGFFYIKGHQIPQALTDNLILTAKRYFDQTAAEKMRDYIGQSDNHSGYVPEGEECFYGGSVDHKESYDVNYDLPGGTATRPMLGANQWPQFPGFKEHVSAYYAAAFDLSKRLFKAFALALELTENYFDKLVTTPPSQLRLIHYPFNPDAKDREGIGAHTDYECFTLLLPTADGLEVMNSAGEWINAPYKPGCFVVNIGDMLEVLSNGRFTATSHRVRKVQQERYSFPLFCSCDYDVVIRPVLPPLPGNSVDKYAPIPCGDHLYAQTIHTFRYMQQRLSEGQIQLPDSACDIATFGNLRDKEHADETV